MTTGVPPGPGRSRLGGPIRRASSPGHAWASRLGEAPAPYAQAAITAAIRFYAIKLEEVVADWDPHLQLDNRPLLELLDAVDQQSSP